MVQWINKEKAIIGPKFGPTGEMEYISEYLHQSVPVCKENLKRIRLTGARVLTSDEAIRLVQERDQKKRKQLHLEKQKAEREET